ncbi:rab GTPase-activating protein 1-like isoform X2 [Pomacea canaliculata]|uniref:rab GTPase-activating protein 1-like isoform X2 n=1 Tax=Pomacea canaliculata TaxID=400727 RepID=UPI000D72E64A|nr:rab GTPase-activating protein 1-like isoform X2 [Pomacea canaliculata]
MEDTVSQESIESSSTGDEFVVVNGEPKLKVTGDFSDIGDAMMSDSTVCDTRLSSSPGSPEDSKDLSHVIPSSQSVGFLADDLGLGDMTESQEDQSGADRGRSVSLPSLSLGDCTIFNGVTYLGCAMVNAPRSEVEIYRNMAVLNSQSHSAIPVALSVPSTSEGSVRLSMPDLQTACNDGNSSKLLDPGSNTDIASFRIHRILFCARGPPDSAEKKCFAFTCSHGDSAETAIFQCHVFRCDLSEAVAKILYCFATTFRRVPKKEHGTSTSSLTELPDTEQDFTFTVGLEFKEDDGKGSYSTCPKDKNIFKFRVNSEKRLAITVQHGGPHQLKIERCFGLLISPGRNVKHSDMQLIELVSMGYTSDDRTYSIAGHWDPTEKCFEILNTETEKDTRVFLTVAVDLVIFGIQEPVRFALEVRAKVYPTSERFWQFTKKPHYERFFVKLKQVEGQDCEPAYEVLKVDSQTDRDRRNTSLSLNLQSASKVPPEPVQTPQDPEDESDTDEPLLSGSGIVSKEVKDGNLLEAWAEVLTRWHSNLSSRPKQVTSLVRKGIPEALRGEVWQLLAGCQDSDHLLEQYRVLITKDSPSEAVIQRDVNRTFPAHDFFKESGGLGQDSLYRISKAYSVYDEDIGYVQGLSFLAAALLLHMPEEQAFCVLTKIMFDYGLRNLFKQGFEELHLKFYQLERLLQDQMSDLYEHFMDMGLEVHMFASQWFLTLFTAKFPLHVVFHILDLYLSEGNLMIFSVALGLLKLSRKDLLSHDFEGVLKYFRVHLPKRFRTEEAAIELMQTAIALKVTGKKIKKYEKEYAAMKEQAMQQEDPVERYDRENKRLLDNNMRLEQENDDLAHELVESKLLLRSELDLVHDRCELLDKDLTQTRKTLKETEEEKKRLEVESAQLKEMCRRELERAEQENTRNTAIISDYKQICSQLSERLEMQQKGAREELMRIKCQIKNCEACSKMLDADGKIKLPEMRNNELDENSDVTLLKRQVRELELELAQTKLALVESECKTQDLTHQLSTALSEIQASKNTWFHKTLTSIREVANTKKDPKE